MILKPSKIVAGFMLMTGAAQAQAGTSGTPQSPLGTPLRDLKITSQMAPNGAGHIAVPDSSIVRPGDAGKRAHTNTRVFVPHEQGPLAQPTAPRPKIGPPPPPARNFF